MCSYFYIVWWRQRRRRRQCLRASFTTFFKRKGRNSIKLSTWSMSYQKIWDEYVSTVFWSWFQVIFFSNHSNKWTKRNPNRMPFELTLHLISFRKFLTLALFWPNCIFYVALVFVFKWSIEEQSNKKKKQTEINSKETWNDSLIDEHNISTRRKIRWFKLFVFLCLSKINYK